MLNIEAEFAALLASKPGGAVQRTRPAFVFQDETGAIVQPTVARYAAGRLRIAAVPSHDFATSKASNPVTVPQM